MIFLPKQNKPILGDSWLRNKRDWLRWGSRCVLIYYSWLLDHMTYLRQAEKRISVLDFRVAIVSENSCRFVNFLNFPLHLLFSQLEKNHMIQEPTEVN